MVRKKFKLNNKQDISIDDKHKLFNDVLIKVLTDQDLLPILWSTLVENGYRLGYKYWYHESGKAGNEMLILIN